jgi:hypothetical protein
MTVTLFAAQYSQKPMTASPAAMAASISLIEQSVEFAQQLRFGHQFYKTT